MNTGRIAELLQPFVASRTLAAPVVLSQGQLESISIYIELMLRWNARINLTAVRDAESIVTRHFGESLFLAGHLLPGSSGSPQRAPGGGAFDALDLGSGAGFPGLPLKIYAPALRLTLAESNHRKAAFLWEAIRTLHLSNVQVFEGRLDVRQLAGDAGPPGGIEAPHLVTMRAVERFDSALHTIAALARWGAGKHGTGKAALLIGAKKAGRVREIISDFSWAEPISVPESRERVLLTGVYSVGHEPDK